MRSDHALRNTILIIALVIGGGIMLWMGIDRINFGTIGLTNISPDYPAQDAVSYYDSHLFTGVLWILSALGIWIAAYGLWNFKEWGRRTGIYSGVIIIFGWLIIEYLAVTQSGYPANIGALFLGLAMFSLSSQRVKDYCNPSPTNNPEQKQAAFNELGEYEAKVFRFLAEGLSPEDIAKKLDIPLASVNIIMSQLRVKIKLQDNNSLIQYASESASDFNLSAKMIEAFDKKTPDDMRNQTNQSQSSQAFVVSSLDDEDQKVLELLAKGLSIPDIARRLNSTAVHVSLVNSRLLKKFGVENPKQLILQATQQGFLKN